MHHMMASATDDKFMMSDKLTPEARRALAEAEERRRNAKAAPLPKEINGRQGPEPTRFGDWENKGITSDF
jgi:hypothetical protein